MKNVAVILAGGVGSRVGADVPKQFIDIEGRPVIAYSIEAFEKTPDIDEIGVVCHPQHMERLKGILQKERFQKVAWVTEGGSDFQHSVLSGLERLKEGCAADDTVLIHYAASPFITREIIEDAIRVARDKGECVSANPIPLLLGSKDGACSERFVDRDAITALNTPHAFRFDRLASLYREAEERGILETTEPHPSSLQFALHRKVWLSKGSTANIKITTKDDVELFRAWVFYKNHRQQG